MLRIILSLLTLGLAPTVVYSAPFELRTTCPPSFEKLESGHCELRTLYEFYESPAQHGGVRVALPKVEARYTPEQIDLGRYLFFDPVLSVNRDMSCASCHQLGKGLSDGRKRSLGAMQGDQRIELNRSAPSLWNVVFLDKFMWDGRADSLPQQAILPLLAEDEMGHTRDGLVTALSSSDAYQALFRQAFNAPVSFENITIALAAFQSSLISLNSRYDRYAHGDSTALNQQEIRGYNAFRGFVARCSQCHIPPLFTDGQLAVIGSPANDQNFADAGAGALSGDPFLQGAFRVPTLRNVTATAPYFHSGQFESLTEVAQFYNNTRGHTSPPSLDVKIHWHVHMTDGPKLSDQNINDIVAFLHTLEDQKNLPQQPSVLPSGLPPVPALSRHLKSFQPKDNKK